MGIRRTQRSFDVPDYGGMCAKVWDVESGVLLATFTCDAAATCCAFINDLKLIAGDNGGRRVHFLRLEEPTAKGQLQLSAAERALPRQEYGRFGDDVARAPEQYTQALSRRLGGLIL